MSHDVEPDLEGDAARGAVQTGLWLSALRCLLTYVVVPAAGVAGLVLGPVGVLLQLLAAVTSTSGARRLWRLGHGLRVPYALVAAFIDLAALTSVAGVFLGPSGSTPIR